MAHIFRMAEVSRASDSRTREGRSAFSRFVLPCSFIALLGTGCKTQHNHPEPPRKPDASVSVSYDAEFQRLCTRLHQLGQESARHEKLFKSAPERRDTEATLTRIGAIFNKVMASSGSERMARLYKDNLSSIQPFCRQKDMCATRLLSIVRDKRGDRREEEDLRMGSVLAALPMVPETFEPHGKPSTPAQRLLGHDKGMESIRHSRRFMLSLFIVAASSENGGYGAIDALRLWSTEKEPFSQEALSALFASLDHRL